MPFDKFPQNGFAKDTEQIAEADSQKGETSYTGGPAAFLSEDDGVGDEAEVEDAVDDTDVGVPEDAAYELTALVCPSAVLRNCNSPDRLRQHHGERPPQIQL